MATYEELFPLLQDSELRNRITVAVGIAADGIRSEAPATANHANRLIWAKRAFSRPRQVAQEIHWAVIIANAAATVTQIKNATDAAIQANVDAAVDIFADGS